jgi:hypothetical protein
MPVIIEITHMKDIPNSPQRDLGCKFHQELLKLIYREIEIMREALTLEQIASIILSSLVTAGLDIEKDLLFPSGTVQKYVTLLTEHRKAGEDDN